ncbi:MAG: polysaccharide deacetylase family protein [Gemmatimonadales bacterium]|nr:polysaccharide deacetylase family protein [Gemmatimonadales bacterium]
MNLTLCYHHISPWRRLYATTPETFARHLELLRGAGWTLLGFDEFAEHSRKPSRARTALVSFDDGHADNWLHAAPVLAAHEAAAVMFLISGDVDEGAVRERGDEGLAPGASEDDPVRIRWSEVEQWAATGSLSVQTHTHRHRDWVRDTGNVSQRAAGLRADLDASIAAITARIGTPPRALAWPWGRSDPALREVAAGCGIGWQFSVIPGVDQGPLRPAALLHRVPADGLDANGFARMLERYRYRPLALARSQMRRRLSPGSR